MSTIDVNLTDHGDRMPRSGRGRNKASQVVILRNPCINIHENKKKDYLRTGTWNVQTMLKPLKIEEVKKEMEKAKLDILGICETRWAGKDDYISGNVRIIQSGNDKGGNRGVAILLSRKWKNNVLNTYHINDRLLMIKLEAQPTALYIIQVYFPTSKQQNEEEVDALYEQIEELLEIIGGKENVFIMGDFNAIVGYQNPHPKKSIGKFGLGKMNERGSKLMDFCQQNELTISNTFFEVPLRRRYTWTQPGDINRYIK